VQGGELYQVDIDGEDDGEQIAMGTKVFGTFCYQMDSASAALWAAPKGTKIRAEMDGGLLDLGNGRTRYEYKEIRRVPPTPAALAQKAKTRPTNGAPPA